MLRIALTAALVLATSPVFAAAGDLAPLLSAQIARCWNPPPGTTGSITVRFDLTQDGHVAGKPKANGLAAKGFADAAIHAVTFCEPYRLPPERYSDWQHAKVTLSTGN